jgi:hypothetical protein
MYRIILLLGFMFFLGADVYAQHDFEWLVGKWKVKDKPVFEIWKKGNDEQTLLGVSFRIQGADTVITERISLTFSEGYYHYIPAVAENKEPVDFTITSYDEKSFIAVNPLHDFPKLIRYTIVRKVEGDFLEAAIEGNGKVIPYTFERVR